MCICIRKKPQRARKRKKQQLNEPVKENQIIIKKKKRKVYDTNTWSLPLLFQSDLFGFMLIFIFTSVFMFVVVTGGGDHRETETQIALDPNFYSTLMYFCVVYCCFFFAHWFTTASFLCIMLDDYVYTT